MFQRFKPTSFHAEWNCFTIAQDSHLHALNNIEQTFILPFDDVTGKELKTQILLHLLDNFHPFQTRCVTFTSGMSSSSHQRMTSSSLTKFSNEFLKVEGFKPRTFYARQNYFTIV